MTSEKFPIMEWTEDTPVHEAVMQAIGAASVCWENPAGAGVYKAERAEAIGGELLDLLRMKLWIGGEQSDGE